MRAFSNTQRQRLEELASEGKVCILLPPWLGTHSHSLSDRVQEGDFALALAAELGEGGRS